jgi:hypothetical protein
MVFDVKPPSVPSQVAAAESVFQIVLANVLTQLKSRPSKYFWVILLRMGLEVKR